VRRLFAAGENKTTFDSVEVRFPDPLIVFQYRQSVLANRSLNEPTGGEHIFQFRSADAAYRAIRRMFVDRAQDESKALIIKRMTG
jgi:hypothetical protein